MGPLTGGSSGCGLTRHGRRRHGPDDDAGHANRLSAGRRLAAVGAVSARRAPGKYVLPENLPPPPPPAPQGAATVASAWRLGPRPNYLSGSTSCWSARSDAPAHDLTKFADSPSRDGQKPNRQRSADRVKSACFITSAFAAPLAAWRGFAIGTVGVNAPPAPRRPVALPRDHRLKCADACPHPPPRSTPHRLLADLLRRRSCRPSRVPPAIRTRSRSGNGYAASIRAAIPVTNAAVRPTRSIRPAKPSRRHGGSICPSEVRPTSKRGAFTKRGPGKNTCASIAASECRRTGVRALAKAKRGAHARQKSSSSRQPN